jgi:hypothetical protein
MSEIEEKVRFEGTKIELQNMKLIIPPLNFAVLRKQGGLKKLQNIQKGFSEAGDSLDISDEIFDDTIDLVWLAARRNYPELTKEQVEEGLDFNNVSKILPILINQNPINEIANQGNAVPQRVKKQQ